MQISDRFVLLREIGSGGMSHVFLGRDEVLDRPVAVKVLKTEYGDTDIGARFQREGRTAAKLSHPNIVQVYDAGEGEFEGQETSFIVMEYISGGDLKALMDELGPLSGGRLSAVGAEAAAGLSHAHERGVIHRDIKPHNILLEEGGRARLADFGIARALDATQATRTGFYLGTALYSPPEQLQGEEVTPKSDVYSLGATLYQAATGEPPFAGTPIEIASQHVSKEPTPPREITPEISGAMEALILACMSKDPNSRPTADESRIALLEAGRGAHATRAYTEAPAEPTSRRTPPPAPPPSAARQSRRRRRPGALLAILAIVAALAVIGALAAYSLRDQQAASGGEANSGGKANSDEQANGNAREARSNDDPAGGQGEPSGQGTASATASSGAASSASSEASPTASPESSSESLAAGSGSGPSGSSAEEEAAQTVEDHYTVAASDDYQDAWNLLSSRYQQEIGSRGQWTDQFRTLERVEYTRGPRARVTGDTATVNFSTLAYHTDRVDEINGAVMYLVQADGEWKIDRLEVS